MLVHTKGRIANRQKQQENARVFFEQSIELLNRSLELNSEHRMTRSVLGVAYGNLALVTLDLDQKESALQIRLDVFHSLVADYPSMPRYKSDLALAHESIADLLTKQNRHQEASDHYRQAIELIEQALQLVPGEPALRYALAGAWQNLALSSSDFDLSSAARKKKLEITRSLVSDFPADPEYKAELADALKDWAKVLAAKDREREAEQLFRESIQLTDALITDFPETWEHQRLFARSRTQLSQMLFGQGRYAETVQLLEEAIPVWIKLAEDRPDELMIFRNLITCQQLMGNSFESLEKTPLPSSAAHELSDHLTQRGQRSEATAFELNYIAWSLLGIEFPTVTEPELALEFAGRACRIAEQQHNANLPLYLDTLAMAQHQAGDSPSAIRTQTRAISLLSESTDKTVADQMDRNLKMYLESESEKSGSKNTDD